jgi:hypothetical protein
MALLPALRITTMILYKYVPFDDGKRILENGSVRFTQPEFFNDPFDLPYYPREASANPVGGIFDRLHTMGKEEIWKKNTGILSLTRTPTNPLMWAHYADKHRGIVIGIDAIAAGLTDEKTNLIPAQYGSVIYVSQRQEQPFIGKFRTGLSVGSTHHFPHDHYEKLQRLFLHKPLCWAYEEEVRVVKCLKGLSHDNPSNPSGYFKVLGKEQEELYLYLLPPEAITEVYFGFKIDTFIADDLFYQAKKRRPELRIFECYLDGGNLSVGFKKYVTLADAANG